MLRAAGYDKICRVRINRKVNFERIALMRPAQPLKKSKSMHSLQAVQNATTLNMSKVRSILKQPSNVVPGKREKRSATVNIDRNVEHVYEEDDPVNQQEANALDHNDGCEANDTDSEAPSTSTQNRSNSSVIESNLNDSKSVDENDEQKSSEQSKNEWNANDFDDEDAAVFDMLPTSEQSMDESNANEFDFEDENDTVFDEQPTPTSEHVMDKSSANNELETVDANCTDFVAQSPSTSTQNIPVASTPVQQASNIRKRPVPPLIPITAKASNSDMTNMNVKETMARLFSVFDARNKTVLSQNVVGGVDAAAASTSLRINYDQPHFGHLGYDSDSD